MSSTARLRQLVGRLRVPRAGALKEARKQQNDSAADWRVLPGAPADTSQWGVEGETMFKGMEGYMQPPNPPQLSAKARVRKRRRNLLTRMLVEDTNKVVATSAGAPAAATATATAAVNSVEDASARFAAFRELVQKRLVSIDKSTEPDAAAGAGLLPKSRLTAAAVAAAVGHLGKVGQPDTAVAFARLAMADPELALPADGDCARLVTEAAAGALTANARVASALGLLADEVEAGRPVSAVALTGVAQSFVRWAPHMDQDFCRVALAERLVDYLLKANCSPTPAFCNAVLALAAQARSRRRFLQFAIGAGPRRSNGDAIVGGIMAVSPHGSSALSDADESDVGITDINAIHCDGTTSRVLLRAVREVRELQAVLRALGPSDFLEDDTTSLRSSKHSSVSKKNSEEHHFNAAVPPQSVLASRNAEVALEYVRALLRVGYSSEAVQSLYQLHRRGLASPTAWNAVLGHLSRRARRGAAEAWLPANNVFRKMCEEKVPLRSRGLKAYVDMLQATATLHTASPTSSSALSSSAARASRSHHATDIGATSASAIVNAAAAADPHRLAAVMQQIDPRSCSAAMMLRLFSAAANAGESPERRLQQVLRLWKRAENHVVAPRGLFQALCQLMPADQAIQTFDQQTSKRAGLAAESGSSFLLQERDLTHSIKLSRGASRNDVTQACEALFILGARGVEPTELFLQRCMGLLKRVALNNGAATASECASATVVSNVTDAEDAAARRQLLKEMSELWFPDAATPVAPALLVEHICNELLRATMMDVSSLVRDRRAELDTLNDTTMAVLDGSVDSESIAAQPFTLDPDTEEHLREKCLQLDEQLTDLLDLWDPKAVIPDPA